MRKEEFEVVSDYDGLVLKGTAFVPDEEAKGIVQFVHGMCECRERYFEFCEFLAANGYVAAVHDQRGHGDSVLSKEDYGYMWDTKATAIVEDAAKVTLTLKEKFPNLPVCLFGHSMGSMVVRCYLHKHDDLIDKLIVCGSPSNNPLAGVAVLLTKAIALFKGDRHRSKLLSNLSTGKADENFPGEPKGCWLSHDRETVDRYYKSEKCGFRFTCNGYENLFRLMQGSYDVNRYEVKNPTLPIHFISGSDDAVLGSEDKWLDAQNTLRRAGYENVSGKLYQGMRHEVHNEIGREEVYWDVIGFLQK